MTGNAAGRRILALWAAISILLALSSQVWAQKRVFARVEPNIDADQKLNFDVNSDPNDNIAPNIFITKDGKRGFVSYTGSGTVLVFSPVTGETLGRIETGGNPAFTAPLPDQKSLAVVSALDNKVFMIDTDNSELLATYAFPDAQFGFGSIVSASPDGSTGYISSTGTGEVIKFSLLDGREAGRLKGFQAPAQITVSNDGGTIIVVDTLTEELAFVDAASLTRKSSLKAREKDPTANFTIFNKAVLSPDGETGIIASRDVNGILAGDVVFLFKTSTGEIIETAAIGSEPGYTTLTPDGKYWAILNEFSLTLINTSDFKEVRELQTVRGEPLGSANILFSPDSRFAYYVSSADDLFFQHDLTTSAVIGQVLLGDNPNQFVDQPASMAITPDGKVIAVLDFMSNRIDLLTNTYVLDAAKFISSAEKFTGLTLINLSNEPATFTITALNDFGEVLAEEGIENPVDYTLPPNNQISLTVAQLFKFDDSQERVGWLTISSAHPEVAGYFSVGDTALTNLDGAPLFKGLLYDFVVSETVRKEGKFAELNLVNPSFNQSPYEVSRILRDGTVQETRTGQIAFPTNRHPQVFGEQFTQPEETTDGYLRYTAPQGLIFTEYFGGDSSTAALNGIDLDSFIGIQKIYSPQFAVVSGFKTILNLINGSGEDTEVTIRLHGPDGRIIGNPLKRSLVKDEQLKDDLAELFKDDQEVTNVTGWLEIESTTDRVVGTVTFTNEEERFLTSFILAGRPMDRFLFPVVAEDSVYQTGVALLNANDVPADVTLELWGPGGTVDRTMSITLPPASRTALYLGGFFSDLEPRLIGNLRIRSTQPLYGFSLINDKDFNFVTALPPIPLP